ncbi:MAG: glycosyltransferase [bacterium]|nr:glycosyltransferase [bacterium]
MPAKPLLIGDGQERVYIEEMVKKLPFCNKVLFLGEIDDIQSILAAADLFLLTSEVESFGLACLEAMACGVPVVATQVGGLPEVIENGKSGFLVKVGDIELS